MLLLNFRHDTDYTFLCGFHVPLIQRATPAAKAVTVSRGRLNHVSAEGVEEDPGVLMGTLRVNAYAASVLFDSGASHSFISISFAHNHQIPFENMDSPLVVRTPGSHWQTKWVTSEVQITIGYWSFPFQLIALKSDGLDVILGMDWLVKYQKQEANKTN